LGKLTQLLACEAFALQADVAIAKAGGAVAVAGGEV
jgi:hypothetical protein